MSDALKKARALLNNKTLGSRIGEKVVSRIILIVLSGSLSSSGLRSAVEERQKLTREFPGLKTITIGATENITEDQLADLSGDYRNTRSYKNGTNITLHVFYNFGETIPNVQTHDFLLSVNEDEEASVLVRSSDQFLNDVCRNNDQRLQSNKDTENQNFGEESQRNENNMYFAIIASINFEKQEQETEADYYDLYYDGYNVERHVTRRPWFAHTNYRFIDGFSALAYI
ncbi:uncharacterized protein LOC142349578 isoform X2 [Convolutriloba macropyga]|uniref:uncharacterized protein LOC142349578 isoform X2 n=1 Tax=Convolutriloba macropyga TaxID=536237 RepID=UPI003F520EBF